MSESTGPQNMSSPTSLNSHGPLDGFREIGSALPGTEITIKKNNASDEDGTPAPTQDKSATADATPSWATTKTQSKHKKPSTPKASSTPETPARSHPKACSSSQAESRN